MVTWALLLMNFLQPNAPWKASYQATATAIVTTVAYSEPLFIGINGRERTVVFLISLAWFESRFNSVALGDCHTKGDSQCKPGEDKLAKAFGLYQQHDHGILTDPAEATAVALQQIRISFRVCHSKELSERLGWYTAGGNDCERGLRESRNRVLKAEWLYKKFPPPVLE